MANVTTIFFRSSFPTLSCRKLYFYKLFYPIIDDFDNFRNLGNNLMVLSELKKVYSQSIAPRQGPRTLPHSKLDSPLFD